MSEAARRCVKKLIGAFRTDSTTFQGDRYSAVETPNETWGCARMVSWRFAAKPHKSVAAIPPPGPIRERAIRLMQWEIIAAGLINKFAGPVAQKVSDL